MDTPMPGLFWRFMAFALRKRDASAFTEPFLSEVDIKQGDTVVDFGCGPGSFSLAAAEKTGPVGRVYAVDIHPLSAATVAKKTRSRGLGNVTTICSGCALGLETGSVDVALLYDVIHMVGEKEKVLAELARVLKPEGLLSVSDHHLVESEVIAMVQASGLFALKRTGEKTALFKKKG